MNKKIQVAVLACGNRSKHVVGALLRDSKRNVEIVSVYDPDPNAVEDVLWTMNVVAGSPISNAPSVVTAKAFALALVPVPFPISNKSVDLLLLYLPITV